MCIISSLFLSENRKLFHFDIEKKLGAPAGSCIQELIEELRKQTAFCFPVKGSFIQKGVPAECQPVLQPVLGARSGRPPGPYIPVGGGGQMIKRQA